MPTANGKPLSIDRSVLARGLVFLTAVIALLALYASLNSLTPQGGAVPVDDYSALDKAALDRIETLCDRGFALATGLIGALGAAFMGLAKGPTLKGPRAYVIALAVVLALGSAMAGMVTRFRLLSMIAGHWPPYLTEPQIQIPFGVQYILLFASIAAIGWYVVDDALRE